MKPAILIVIAAVIVAAMVFHPGGNNTSSHSNANQSTAEPTTAPRESLKPPGSTWPPTPTPTATPVPVAADADALNAAIADTSTPQPFNIHFDGSDVEGTVSFDVVTDGKGDLSGSYNRAGLSAQIVVISGKLYMQGASAIASYTGVPQDSSVTGWVHIPSWAGPGILGTIATPRELHDCIEATRTGVTGYVVAPSQVVNGVAALTYEPTPAPAGLDWLFAISPTAPHHLLSWQYLMDSSVPQPAVCNYGVGNLTGPAAGPKGVFTLSPGTPTTIATPPGAVELTIPGPAET